ncbi:adenosine receptor A2a-like [Glandiceps talaboti]
MSPANSTSGLPGEEEYESPWYYILLNIVFGAAIILENLLVLLSVYINKKLQDMDTFCIVNLACADLLVGIVFSFHFTYTIVMPYSCTNIHACAVVFAAMPAMVMVSVFALMVMSIDRYISVSQPLEYATIVTTKRMLIIITIQWVVSIFFGAMPVILWQGDPATFEGCLNTEIISNTKAAYLWYWMMTFLPTVVLIILYGRLFCVAYRHARRVAPIAKQLKQNATGGVGTAGCDVSTINLPSAVTRNTPFDEQSSNTLDCYHKKVKIVNRAYKAVVTLGIIMVCMVCTFIPSQVMFISFNCDDCINMPHIHLRALMVLAQVSNSAMNPFIYAIRIKEFRRTFTLILKTTFCCRCKKASRTIKPHEDGDHTP